MAHTLVELFERMAPAGASDLHLCAGSAPMLRVRGELTPMDESPFAAERVRNLVYSIATLEQQKTLEVERELDFSYALGSSRFRVNVFYDRGNVAAVARLVPHTIPTLEELHMPEVIGELALRRRGLVLVTGATGSGKSTTLAAMIDKINSERSCHIVTIEDPIEFIHTARRAFINQREVGADTRSFGRALRSALRQDPDVILVGELRDLESIAIALTAAETGHLVFATLHTRDAAGAVDRIIDVFPSEQQEQIRVQLASSLQGIVAQALLPTADGKGRRAAVEVMLADDAVRNLIRQAKMQQVHNYLHTGGKNGMQTLEQDLGRLVKDGVVTAAEAMKYANDKQQLSRFVAGRGRPRAVDALEAPSAANGS